MEKYPVNADGKDRIFAVIYFLVGYLFVYVFTEFWNFERNLALFTVFYAVIVLLYLWQKGVRPSTESYFWLAIMLSLGLPYGFWSVFPFLQVIGLIFVAAYWTLSVSGHLLIRGRTSQYVFFDWWNSIAVVPFCNFTCQFRVLFENNKQDGEEERKDNQFLSILLGAVIVIPVLLIILPLFSRADAGFESMIGGMLQYITDHLLMTIVRILVAIPVASYLYGLIFGSISERNTDRIRKENIEKTGKNVRKIPDIAVGTVLFVICLVYVIFMAIQGKYLFSAFLGEMPEGFTYAEYARRGFFELCQIGAWNLIFLVCAGIFSKTETGKNRMIQILAVCLSVLTLMLLMTAASKMLLYIWAYGLTVKRVLTMVFMIWMGIVFVCVMIHQKKEIALVRFCVMAGAVMFSLLCLFPVEEWIEVYNTWMF